MTGDLRTCAAPRRRRLAVARFWHEGNAFGPLPADTAAFERCEWRRGAAALAAARGTETELAAVVDFSERQPQWDVVTLRCASALPAGPIDEAVFQRYADELGDDLVTGLADGGWDAVYLSLHGAAITTARQTPDLDLVRLVRRVLPQVALGASFDLHGNMAPEFAALLDAASVYRTHPHVDMKATAARVLDALHRCVDGGLRTRCVLRNEGVLLGSFNMRTGAGPMRELEAAARAATTGAICEVALFGGFPYSDTLHTGASVLVVSDARLDPHCDAAAQAAQALTNEIRRLAPAFDVRLPSPREAIAKALADARPGLVAVTDPADNPLSGGGGDTPGLLRALLEARVAVPSLFASFADQAVVAAARQAGVGQSMVVTLGARFGAHFGAGVELRVTVECLTDGVFRNVGPMQTGVEVRCGGSTVLVVDEQPAVRIIVTEQVVPADDPAFFALHQVDLATLRLLCVKAKNHFRAAFAQRCSEIIDCDAPGPACVDLTRLPFRNVRVPAQPRSARPRP
jgi:microcystin degradation protein MlrC